MSALRTLSWAVLCVAVAACGGGGGDDDTPDGGGGGGDASGGGGELDPTVSNVDPPSGPLAGGTEITITGMHLQAGGDVFVIVGETLAGAATVDGDGTVRVATPPGAEGTYDVVVFNASGFVRATDAYTYNPLPTVTSVAPTLPRTGGPITITGTGFTAGLAGDNTVTVGGAACAGATAASDTSITCTAPAGTTWGQPLAVTNRNGEAHGLVSYARDELFALDGKGGTAGNAYVVATADATTTVVVALPVPFTGATIAPDGRAFGITATGGDANAHIYELDLDFGATDYREIPNQNLPDTTSAGGVLYTWSEDDDNLLSIDPATGATTAVGVDIGSAGSGLAAFSDGKLFFTPNESGGTAYLIDPVARTSVQLGTLTGDTVTGEINALTFHHGVLYGAVNEGEGGPSHLIRIDPTTLVVTAIGALPAGVDALLSGVPEAPVSPPPPVDPPPPPARVRPLPDLTIDGLEGRRVLSGRGPAAAVASRVVATTCQGVAQRFTAPVGGTLSVRMNQKGKWKIEARGTDGSRETLARGLCRVAELPR